MSEFPCEALRYVVCSDPGWDMSCWCFHEEGHDGDHQCPMCKATWPQHRIGPVFDIPNRG